MGGGGHNNEKEVFRTKLLRHERFRQGATRQRKYARKVTCNAASNRGNVNCRGLMKYRWILGERWARTRGRARFFMFFQVAPSWTKINFLTKLRFCWIISRCILIRIWWEVLFSRSVHRTRALFWGRSFFSKIYRDLSFEKKSIFSWSRDPENYSYRYFSNSKETTLDNFGMEHTGYSLKYWIFLA